MLIILLIYAWKAIRCLFRRYQSLKARFDELSWVKAYRRMSNTQAFLLMALAYTFYSATGAFFKMRALGPYFHWYALTHYCFAVEQTGSHAILISTLVAFFHAITAKDIPQIPAFKKFFRWVFLVIGIVLLGFQVVIWIPIPMSPLTGNLLTLIPPYLASWANVVFLSFLIVHYFVFSLLQKRTSNH